MYVIVFQLCPFFHRLPAAETQNYCVKVEVKHTKREGFVEDVFCEPKREKETKQCPRSALWAVAVVVVVVVCRTWNFEQDFECAVSHSISKTVFTFLLCV